MKNFTKDMLERAVKTAAQSALATLTAGYTGLIGIDWQNVLSIVGLATLLSVLSSLASQSKGDPETAGLTTLTKVVTLPVPAKEEVK